MNPSDENSSTAWTRIVGLLPLVLMIATVGIGGFLLGRSQLVQGSPNVRRVVKMQPPSENPTEGEFERLKMVEREQAARIESLEEQIRLLKDRNLTKMSTEEKRKVATSLYEAFSRAASQDRTSDPEDMFNVITRLHELDESMASYFIDDTAAIFRNPTSLHYNSQLHVAGMMWRDS